MLEDHARRRLFPEKRSDREQSTVDIQDVVVRQRLAVKLAQGRNPHGLPGSDSIECSVLIRVFPVSEFLSTDERQQEFLGELSRPRLDLSPPKIASNCSVIGCRVKEHL